MSTTIKDLPFTKGIVVIEQVWRTKVKIKIKDKFYTINTPQSFGVCNVGDVLMAEKVDYKMAQGSGKKITATRVATTSPELLPLKKGKDVELMKRGNGLAKIKIDDTEYIILQRTMAGLADMNIGDIQKFKSKVYENGRIGIFVEYDIQDEENLFAE